MMRIAVLCSGSGSNLQAILDACARSDIDGRVVLVLTSAKKAYALTRAKEAGIPAIAIHKNDFATLEEAQAVRHDALVAAQPDLIVLAGFLGILPPQTIAVFGGRILNTHPALLPAFGGKGMFGHHVHEAVLASGVKLSGATVHLVDEGTDTGPILLQESVCVLPDDTPDTLAARVMAVEHRLLPHAVAAFCQHRIKKNKRGNVIIDEGESTS